MTETITHEKIRLTVQHSMTLHDENPPHADSYKLTYKILETSRDDIPAELFLFRRRPLQLVTDPEFDGTRTIDHFSSVCSASDLYSYPVNNPQPDSRIPFFRKSQYTLILESLAECYNVIHKTDYLLETLLESIHNIEQSIDTPPRIIEA